VGLIPEANLGRHFGQGLPGEDAIASQAETWSRVE